MIPDSMTEKKKRGRPKKKAPTMRPAPPTTNTPAPVRVAAQKVEHLDEASILWIAEHGYPEAPAPPEESAPSAVAYGMLQAVRVDPTLRRQFYAKAMELSLATGADAAGDSSESPEFSGEVTLRTLKRLQALRRKHEKETT